MSRAAVDTLLYLLDFGFDGNPEHSVLGNLQAVTEEDWDWRAPGSGRSLRDLVLHVITAKHVYANQAFGDASISWNAGSREVHRQVRSLADAFDWLRRTHSTLREGVAALDDSDLDKPRKVHYGGTEETRQIIASMIQHDLYHSGEINHLRAMRQGTDFWPGQGPRR